MEGRLRKADADLSKLLPRWLQRQGKGLQAKGCRAVDTGYRSAFKTGKMGEAHRLSERMNK